MNDETIKNIPIDDIISAEDSRLKELPPELVKEFVFNKGTRKLNEVLVLFGDNKPKKLNELLLLFYDKFGRVIPRKILSANLAILRKMGQLEFADKKGIYRRVS